VIQLKRSYFQVLDGRVNPDHDKTGKDDNAGDDNNAG
jgi:hypothetical protein